MKYDRAIARVQMAYEILQHRGEKLYVAYSGGKDSDCIAQICREAVGIDAIEINYNATGIDPPELVRHVKQQFRRWRDEGMECNFNNDVLLAGNTMHNLIVEKGPPTRKRRYCCEVYKERGGKGRVVVTGVRWAESVRRRDNHGSITHVSKNKKNRAMFYDAPYEQTTLFMDDNDANRKGTEYCPTKAQLTINPIIDWPDKYVWDFIRERELTACPAYAYGFHRLGCIGCPMAGNARYREFARWPCMQRYYMRAFSDYIEAHPEAAERNGWHTAEDVWHWWMEDGVMTGQEEMDLEAL